MAAFRPKSRRFTCGTAIPTKILCRHCQRQKRYPAETCHRSSPSIHAARCDVQSASDHGRGRSHATQRAAAAIASRLIYGQGRPRDDATCSVRCSRAFRSGSRSACSARSRCPNEKNQLIDADAFPDLDYVPPDDDCPFEYKASDWGRLPDGRLVALDYSAPALD
jgi:hypothetical protein